MKQCLKDDFRIEKGAACYCETPRVAVSHHSMTGEMANHIRSVLHMVLMLSALLLICVPAFAEDLRLDIKTNEFGNLHISRDVIDVSCYLHGLEKRLEGLVFEGQVYDREGKVIRNFSEKIDDFSGGVAQGVVDSFRFRDPGLYRLFAEATYRGGTLASGQTDFAVVAAPSFSDSVDTIPFGLILKPERGYPYYEIGRQLENLNIEWVKIPFYWHDLDVGLYEEAVERLHARDVRLVGQLAGIAREAARTQEDHIAGPLGPSFASTPPQDFSQWEGFVYDMVYKYRERVHYWEIWADPDGGANWQGTAEEFNQMFLAAVRAIERADPQAKIINPGLLNQTDDFGVQVARETSEFTDIISLNNDLLTDLPLEDMPEKWQRASEVVPLWIGESRGGSAAVTAQDYILAKTSTIQRTFRYGYRDIAPTRRASSFVSESFTPTENAIVYSALSNLLEKTQFVEEMVFPGETKGFVFEEELTKYLVLWHEDHSLLGNRKWPVGLHVGAWWPKMFDMYGHRSTLGPFWRSNMTLWVGDEPIVLQMPKTASLHPVSPSTWKVKLERRRDWKFLEAERSLNTGPQWREESDLEYSAGRALRLEDSASAEDAPTFLYEFDLKRTGSYEILFAGSPLSKLPWEVSPFQWQMDQEKKSSVSHPGIEERIYADKKAGLTSLGTMSLGSGQHTLKIDITGKPANGTGEHNLMIDSIILRPVR